MSGESIKTKAIVVRSINSSDNDKMLTLLSPEMGKITVVAKGVKSLHHKSRGSVQMLCYSEFVLKKLRDGFYSLVSAELLEGFRPICESVELLAAGNYFASLCEMCIQANMGADEEVRLLLNTLYVLSKRPDALYLIKAVFEIKLMEICGIMPEFENECPCGSEANYFCIPDGEVRCKEHRDDQCVPMTKGMLAFSLYISNSSLRDSLFANCNFDDAAKLSSIIEPFLEYHLGKLPNSLQYLHNILK